MFFRIKVMGILLFSIILLMGCGPDMTTEPLQDPVIEEEVVSEKENEENDQDKVTVVSYDFAPVQYLENGEAAGPFVEVAHEAFQRIGVEYEIVQRPFARALEMIRTGEADVMIDLYDTFERRAFMIYTEQPTGFYTQSIVYPKNRPIAFDGSVESLQGLNLGAVLGFSYGPVIDHAIKEGHITVEAVSDQAQSYSKMLEGRLDGVLDYWLSYKAYVEANQLADRLVVSDVDLELLYTYFGLSKANDRYALRDQLDQALREIHEDGTYQAIMDAYDMSWYGEKMRQVMKDTPPREKFFYNPKEGPLQFAFLADTAPYSSLEGEELAGLFPALMQEVMGRLHYDVSFRAYPFSRTLELLKNGKIHGAADVFVKEEREQFLLYPFAYPAAEFPYTLFKRTDSDFTFDGSPEALKGKRIGYIRGYSLGSYDQYVNNEAYNFIAANSPETNMENLLLGRVDVAVDVRSTGLGMAETLGALDKVEPLNPPLNSNFTYIVFSRKKGLEKLVAEYEYVIQSMIDDGSLRELYEEYDVRIPIWERVKR